MPKHLLPSFCTSTFFQFWTYNFFVILNVVIYMYFKYVFLIGITSVYCSKNTVIVQLADDLILD